MQFKTLALVYTWKCNARCDFCCYSCGPKRNKKLSLNTALSILNEANKFDEIKHLSITGGEPFLFLPEIKELIIKWKSFGKTVNCVTNAFWATSKGKAKQILDDLKNCGLTTISISCDIYHQKYVSIERVKNAFVAAKDLSMNLEINCSRGGDDPHLADILPEIKGLKGVYQEGVLVPSGRGAKLQEAKFTYLEELPNERCGMLHALTVMPNGNVYPCCSVFGETKFLSLGNIYKNSLTFIIEEAYANTLLVLMERQGFGALIELGKKVNPNIIIPGKVVNTCHLCHELFSDIRCATPILEGVAKYENELFNSKF